MVSSEPIWCSRNLEPHGPAAETDRAMACKNYGPMSSHAPSAGSHDVSWLSFRYGLGLGEKVERGRATPRRKLPGRPAACSTRIRIEDGRALEEHSATRIGHPDSAKPRHGIHTREADRSLVQR
jgi:hypothetical protein